MVITIPITILLLLLLLLSLLLLSLLLLIIIIIIRSRDYGGHKTSNNDRISSLPFDCCALSLTKYEIPVCSQEGILFDYVNIVEYIKQYNINPCNGKPMKVNDLIKLNMVKNEANEWMCPVTCKPFNSVRYLSLSLLSLLSSLLLSLLLSLSLLLLLLLL